MSFARQKRLLLAALAVVAPVPLPFNEVIAWPVLALFWLAVAFFAYRAWHEAQRWLSGWEMNLLALGYLPFFFGDLTLFWRGQVLQPLAHLALFTLAVKLFALKREADKWHALLAIFFLFLAGMGSSVHPSVVLYQLVLLGLSIVTLVRFAGYHELARAANGAVAGQPVPVVGFSALAVVAVLVTAVPLFVFLPRLRQPYLVAPGVGGGGGQVTGFTDRITLDTIGRVRTSSAVAFRFAFDGPPPQLPEYRFRVAAYDLFRGNAWRPGSTRTRLLRRSPDGFFQVAPGRPRSWASVWMKPTTMSRLALPAETVSLDLAGEILVVDDSGAFSLIAMPTGAISYRAGLESRPPTTRVTSAPEEFSPADLDRSAVTPRMTALAEEIAAGAEPAEAAERLERHLMRSYAYSLELLPGQEEQPVERFLFETREGHCEYFATAMVLLLRARGIPARFVTGYYGAEFNPIQEYFIVRLSNAHAWVEAYLPGEGWRIFDPTPAAGLPSAGSGDWTRLFAQAYDYLLFRWDRYILTYGFNDQAGFFFRLRSLWRELWERLGRDRSVAEETGAPPATETATAPEAGAEPSAGPLWERYRWLPLLLLLAVPVLWLLRRPSGLRAVDAYRHLRHDLERRKIGVDRATPPLELERRLRRRWPAAERPAARILALYLEESFAGRPTSDTERRELKEALRRVRQELRKTA